MAKNLPETHTNTGEVVSTPRPGSLSTLTRVRRELGRVYRDARTGKIDPNELTKFAYTLNVMGKLLEGESFEERLKALEQTIEGKHENYRSSA